jgi:hypothetical protein
MKMTLTHPPQNLRPGSIQHNRLPNEYPRDYIVFHDGTPGGDPFPMWFMYYVYLHQLDYEQVNWVEELLIENYLDDIPLEDQGPNIGQKLLEIRINNVPVKRDVRQFNTPDDGIIKSNYLVMFKPSQPSDINISCQWANYFYNDIKQEDWLRDKVQLISFALQNLQPNEQSQPQSQPQTRGLFNPYRKQPSNKPTSTHHPNKPVQKWKHRY